MVVFSFPAPFLCQPWIAILTYIFFRSGCEVSQCWRNCLHNQRTPVLRPHRKRVHLRKPPLAETAGGWKAVDGKAQVTSESISVAWGSSCPGHRTSGYEDVGQSAQWRGSLCCRSIKHYFLLDQGDFIVQFMDMADDELKKPMEGTQRNSVSLVTSSKLLSVISRFRVMMWKFFWWKGLELSRSHFLLADIMDSRLEALLELTLRTSTANADSYKDDLR